MENIYTYHFFHSFFIMKKRGSDMTESSKDRHYLIIYLRKTLLNTLTYQYQDTKDPCSKLDYSVLFCSHLFHSKNIIECQLQQHSVQLLVLVLNFFYLPENLILEWSILLYLNIEISMTDQLLLNDKIIKIILLINFILVNNSWKTHQDSGKKMNWYTSIHNHEVKSQYSPPYVEPIHQIRTSWTITKGKHKAVGFLLKITYHCQGNANTIMNKVVFILEFIILWSHTESKLFLSGQLFKVGNISIITRLKINIICNILRGTSARSMTFKVKFRIDVYSNQREFSFI